MISTLRTLCVLGLLSTAAAAQHRDAPRDVARVTGIVYDSVSHAPLRGASVQLVSLDASRTTMDRQTAESDSTGRYEFSLVRSGAFAVGFYHAKLDSLGIDAPLSRVEVDGSSSIHAVDLAVPSVATVLAVACGPDAARDSTGVMIGFVRRATAVGVIAGAAVRARWSEISIGRAGAQLRIRSARTHTSDMGWFALCGVPPGGLVLVNATTGSDSGATLELEMPPSGLLVRDVFVDEHAHLATRSLTSLRGTVRDPYGEPLADARVRLWGDSSEVRTNLRGEFALTQVPAGTRMVELRALGYTPRRALVDLVSMRESVVEFPLDDTPTAIDTVRVFGRSAGARNGLAEFERRRALSHGVFLDPDAVERRRPLSFTDLLRGITGVDVVSIRGSRAVVMHSATGMGKCEPELIIDGMNVPRQEMNIDDLVSVAVIRALEVYPRRIQAPPQYQSLTCGTIIVWTGGTGWLAKQKRSASRDR
ncbi:MAG: carboxypeptidase-like regulatory domain-containing protein [Gemmatimonadaceae bacterium]